MSGVQILNGSFVVVTWDQLCETKIENLRLAAIGDKNVGWLNVAVNDAFFVSGVEGIGELDAKFEGSVHGLRATANDLVERFSFEKFQRKKSSAVVLFDGVDGADAGVIEGRSCAGLAKKTLKAFRILQFVFGKEF